MDEIEYPPITITAEDISAANQLSEHCPICGSPVEREAAERALDPVACADCGTLYHKACWEQLGNNVCAMIGCNCKKYRPYGTHASPLLTISATELPQSRNGVSRHTKELKAAERRMYDEVHGRGPLRRFFDWLLRQIKILDEA